MNRKEAKRLKIGDRVQIWAESPDACSGVIIEVGYNAVKTKWDDGQVGVIHLNDHKNVTWYYGTAPIVPILKTGATG